MQLPSEVAELVKEYFPSQMKNIPLWKEPVERAFSKQDLKATLSTFTEHIGAHSVAHLGVLSDLISTKIDGKLLSSDELNGLKSQFNKLLDDITVADINNDIKAYLTRELEKLIRLIREYTIFGAEPILKQIDCIFGHVVRNKKYHSFFRDEALGKTLFDGLAAMANVLTVSIGLPQLSVVIDTLLPKQ